MVYLRACPKCYGDMIERDDPEGPEAVCIQCGKTLGLVSRAASPARVASPAA
jgi:hypothetical protein